MTDDENKPTTNLQEPEDETTETKDTTEEGTSKLVQGLPTFDPRPIIKDNYKQAVRRDSQNKTHKRCIKCRIWKPRKAIVDDSGNITEKAGFGKHNSSDGLQSICHSCKNDMNKDARGKDVSARLRHHISTRCLTQLGSAAPKSFVKDMETYLGYRIEALVKSLKRDLKEREGKTRKLRDALSEGYHVDHKKPLSLFSVVVEDSSGNQSVDWDMFKECWAIENLSAIPASENLAKGAKFDQEDVQTPLEQDQHQNKDQGPGA